MSSSLKKILKLSILLIFFSSTSILAEEQKKIKELEEIYIYPEENYEKDSDYSDYYDDEEYGESDYGVEEDPLISFNRRMFAFNETIDDIIFEPVARGYRYVVPQYGRDRVSNFVDNLSSPVDFVNFALQGDVDRSVKTFWRTFVNTTFGIGGLFDVASGFGLKKMENDFGITMANYGYEESDFIVLPFFGPTTVRDTLGRIVDSAVNPSTYFASPYNYVYSGVSLIDKREGLLNTTDNFDALSLDPYSSMRSGYMQYRENKIKKISSGRNAE